MSNPTTVFMLRLHWVVIGLVTIGSFFSYNSQFQKNMMPKYLVLYNIFIKTRERISLFPLLLGHSVEMSQTPEVDQCLPKHLISFILRKLIEYIFNLELHKRVSKIQKKINKILFYQLFKTYCIILRKKK